MVGRGGWERSCARRKPCTGLVCRRYQELSKPRTKETVPSEKGRHPHTGTSPEAARTRTDSEEAGETRSTPTALRETEVKAKTRFGFLTPHPPEERATPPHAGGDVGTAAAWMRHGRGRHLLFTLKTDTLCDPASALAGIWPRRNSTHFPQPRCYPSTNSAGLRLGSTMQAPPWGTERGRAERPRPEPHPRGLLWGKCLHSVSPAPGGLGVRGKSLLGEKKQVSKQNPGGP